MIEPMIWTAIMIISIHGQPQELRGAQSVSEGACQQALLKWWLAVAMQRPAPKVIDTRCVFERDARGNLK